MALFLGWTFERDIASWVIESTWVRRIKTFESPVLREGDAYWLALPQGKLERLVGVTTIIDRALVVDDPDTLLMRKLQRRRAREQEKNLYGKRRRKRTGARKIPLAVSPQSPLEALKGRELGNLVHRQLLDVLTSQTYEQFRDRPGNSLGIHPYVPRVIKYLLKLGVRPFLAEFRVHDLRIQCATQIDMLAVDAVGRIAFIELKTGYSGGRYNEEHKGETWINPALARHGTAFLCTPRNKAIVQVLLGAEMCIRELQIPRNMTRYIVLRIDKEGHSRSCFTSKDYAVIQQEVYASLENIVAHLDKRMLGR